MLPCIKCNNEAVCQECRCCPTHCKCCEIGQEYVVGFYFDQARENVVLIEKKRPDWQAGRWNGVGGKIEQGETHTHAMRREFREEAGIEVNTFEHFLTLQGRAWIVYFFRAFGPHTGIRSMTDEELKILSIRHLHTAPTIGNLQWIIPLSLDCNLVVPIQIKEKY